MCGIYGSAGKNLPTPEEVVENLELISHRGPDGIFLSSNGDSILGMCRLAIRGIDSNTQPATSPNGRFNCVFNGQIYNYQILAEKYLNLNKKNSAINEASLILELFDQFNVEMFNMLEGMFAIAIFDTESSELFLVRDRFGEKPLFYSTTNNQITFSSEIKILTDKTSFDTLNKYSAFETLFYGYTLEHRTIYQDIYRLEPGHYLRWKAKNGTSIRSYFQIKIESTKNDDFVLAKSKVKSLLREAIRKCLDSDREVGFFLSSGIDSSTLLAIASEVSTSKLNTFSMGFGSDSNSELDKSFKIAEKIGSNHSFLEVNPGPEDLIEIIRKLDQPFGDSSFIASYLLSKFASKSIKVAIGGDGADEIFAGYTRYSINSKVKLLNYWLSLANSFSDKSNQDYSLNKLTKIIEDLNLKRYEKWQSVCELNDFQRIIQSKEMFEPINLRNLLVETNFENQDLIGQMQILDLKSYLPNDILFKTDFASMNNSIELRSPYLDANLTNYVSKLPSEYKVNKKSTKHILKSINRDYFGDFLTNLPKKGFSIPKASYFIGDSSDVLFDKILEGRTSELGLTNQLEIQKLIKRHLNGENFTDLFWNLLVLEVWIESHCTFKDSV